MESTPPTPAALPKRQVLIVFSGIMLGMLLAAVDQTIVATALPTITGELGGLDHLAWVITAYLLAETVATPVYGKLGDLYGRKRLFQSAIVVFLVGSALSGVAGSMGMLIAFRAVQGVGAGGLIVLAQALIADIVSPRERGRYHPPARRPHARGHDAGHDQRAARRPEGTGGRRVRRRHHQRLPVGRPLGAPGLDVHLAAQGEAATHLVGAGPPCPGECERQRASPRTCRAQRSARSRQPARGRAGLSVDMSEHRALYAG